MLADYFGPGVTVTEDVDEQVIKLRVNASSLLVHVIDNYSEYYPTLKPRVIATLLQALLFRTGSGEDTGVTNPSGSIETKLGAVIALHRLGPSSFKTLLGRVGVLPPMEEDKKENAADIATHGDMRVPLNVLGQWLKPIKDNADASRHESTIIATLIDEVKEGIKMLHHSEQQKEESSAPMGPALEHLDATYGTFWTRDALKDNAVALVTLERYSSLAIEKE